MNIVCFSNIDWSFLTQRHQHLMLELSKIEDVENIIFIETLGTRGVKLSAEDVKRGVRKVFNVKGSKNALKKEDIKIIKPKFIPIFNKLAFCINKVLLKRNLKKTFKQLNIDESDTIAWVMLPHPSIASLLKEIKFKSVIYDCIDDLKSIPNVKSIILETEKEIMRFCNWVSVTSQQLFEYAKQYNEKVYLIKNAVCKDLISTSYYSKGNEKKVIGYIGTIYEWFDIDVIEELAKSREDIEIALVGPIRIDVEKIKKYSNVHLYGSVSYELVKEYLEGFDVCIIPFKLNELTENTNPVKFYEYCAKSKPIVSSRLPEVSIYEECVYIYDNKKDFVRNIDIALKESSIEKKNGRLKIAIENTWCKRAEFIINNINYK